MSLVEAKCSNVLTRLKGLKVAQTTRVAMRWVPCRGVTGLGCHSAGRVRRVGLKVSKLLLELAYSREGLAKEQEKSETCCSRKYESTQSIQRMVKTCPKDTMITMNYKPLYKIGNQERINKYIN